VRRLRYAARLAGLLDDPRGLGRRASDPAQVGSDGLTPSGPASKVASVSEPRGLARHQVAGRRGRRDPAEVSVEVLAVEQLHREEPVAVLLEQLVEPDQVAMAEIAQAAKLALEPVQQIGVTSRSVLSATRVLRC
jgi:hypothetical protein